MSEDGFTPEELRAFASRRFAGAAAEKRDAAFETLNADLASFGVTLRFALAAQFQNDQELERAARRDPEAFILLLERVNDADEALAPFRRLIEDSLLRTLTVLARLPPEVKWP